MKKRMKVRMIDDSRNIGLIRGKIGYILDCVQLSDDDDDVKYLIHFNNLKLTLELDNDQFEIC